MKSPVRRILLIAASLSVLAFGVSPARVPPTGSGWIEYQYYDDAGNLVGARLIDCNGDVSIYGVFQGSRIEVAQGSCT